MTFVKMLVIGDNNINFKLKVFPSMIATLTLSVPFFALIFLGMGCRMFGFFDDSAAKILSRFAFYIVLPTFMFINVANNDPSGLLNWGFIWRYELSTLIIFISSAFIGSIVFRLTTHQSGVLGLASAYPNYGYMGVPLAIMAFGAEAALPMALILITDTIVLLALVAAFVAPRQGNPLIMVFSIVKTMISNPLLLSVVFGTGFAIAELKLPIILDNLVNIIAGAAAPTALFALGVTLYGQPIKSAIGEIGVITIWRLIAHPLLLIVIFVVFPGQDMLWMNVAILFACLPVAANVYMLAQHYDHYVNRAATSCLVSTIIATVTVPIVLYMLIEGKLIFLMQ